MLTRVRIGEVSLTDGVGTSLRFVDCTVGTVELHNSRVATVDLSTSALTKVDGLDSMRGLVLTLDQVLELGPAMATHLGVTIAE